MTMKDKNTVGRIKYSSLNIDTYYRLTQASKRHSADLLKEIALNLSMKMAYKLLIDKLLFHKSCL